MRLRLCSTRNAGHLTAQPFKGIRKPCKAPTKRRLRMETLPRNDAETGIGASGAHWGRRAKRFGRCAHTLVKRPDCHWLGRSAISIHALAWRSAACNHVACLPAIIISLSTALPPATARQAYCCTVGAHSHRFLGQTFADRGSLKAKVGCGRDYLHTPAFPDVCPTAFVGAVGKGSAVSGRVRHTLSSCGDGAAPQVPCVLPWHVTVHRLAS